MARILFIVNEHPNEAFGIPAAMETARGFQRQGFRLLVEGKDRIPKTPQGNEIVWVKVKPTDTLLGRILKGLPLKTKRQRESGADVEWYWSMVRGSEIREAKSKKYGPNAIYSWHCSPQGGEIYFKKGSRADYDIRNYETSVGGNAIPTRIVEMKTYQRGIPERLLKQIRKRAEQKPGTPLSRYITHTTSQELTRNAGLTPEAFGKKLAEQILREVQAIERQRRLGNVRRSIPRIWPQARRSRRRK